MATFNRNSTAEEVSSEVALNGYHALAAGANAGIGWATVRVLALRGALLDFRLSQYINDKRGNSS